MSNAHGLLSLFAEHKLNLVALPICDSNLVGFVYPVYASFKAIETPCPEDDKQWCVS